MNGSLHQYDGRRPENVTGRGGRQIDDCVRPMQACRPCGLGTARETMRTIRILRVAPIVLVAGVLLMPAASSAQTGADQGQRRSPLSAIISGGLDAVADRALPLLIAMAAIGVVTMAVQQAIKDVGQLHVGFNRRHFARWATARHESPQATIQLLELATGGNSEA